MNSEKKFREARSIALHDSRLLIGLDEDEGETFDFHGCEYGLMQGYQIDPIILADYLRAFGIQTREWHERFQGKPTKKDIMNIDGSILGCPYSILKCIDIEKILVCENTNNSIEVKICSIKDNGTHSISYSGRYSIYWGYSDNEATD